MINTLAISSSGIMINFSSTTYTLWNAKLVPSLSNSYYHKIQAGEIMRIQEVVITSFGKIFE